MFMLFDRKAIFPVWLCIFGLFALLGPPMTFLTGTLVFTLGGLALASLLALWNEPPSTVAEVLHRTETTRSGRGTSS